MRYWKCQSDCQVHLITENNLLISVGDQSQHTHGSEIIEIVVLHFLNRLRNAIEMDPSQLLENLYRKELELVPVEIRPEMPQYASLRHTLTCYRRNVLPKLPKNSSEIDLTDNLRLTKDGENFVLWDANTENRFLILGTEENLKLLCKCEKIYMDGTFQTIPRPLFFQMYTLHGEIKNKIFPLLFCLLSNKTQQTYERLLTTITNIAAQRGLIFQPKCFQLDFEKAVLIAINIVFPLAEIKRCYFHYCQAIWRKIQELGLTKIYKDNKDIKRWFRMLFILPLVNLDDLDDAWLLIMSERPNVFQIDELLDYLVNTWIDDMAANNRYLCSHYYSDTN